MSDLSPGQEVHVPGTFGGTVVYVRGESVRVLMHGTGKKRTVPLKAVTPKRESKSIGGDYVPIHEIYETSASPLASVLLSGGGRPVPKPVTLYSEPYLAYVRKHPCCLCGAPGPSEPHHWSHHGGVMGAKVDDYRTVPLCQEHHRYWHDHGTLPDRDRVGSEAFFIVTQRELLIEWAMFNAGSGDVVDALIRAIGGADA